MLEPTTQAENEQEACWRATTVVIQWVRLFGEYEGSDRGLGHALLDLQLLSAFYTWERPVYTTERLFDSNVRQAFTALKDASSAAKGEEWAMEKTRVQDALDQLQVTCLGHDLTEY